jgi:hypothetical protein
MLYRNKSSSPERSQNQSSNRPQINFVLQDQFAGLQCAREWQSNRESPEPDVTHLLNYSFASSEYLSRHVPSIPSAPEENISDIVIVHEAPRDLTELPPPSYNDFVLLYT